MSILKKYIREQLSRGYNIGSIRAALARSGYPLEKIDKAINSVYSVHEIRHTFNLSKTALIALIIIILAGAGIASFFIFSKEKLPAQLLDVSTKAIILNVQPNQELRFSTELSNLGSKKRYDIALEHEIINIKTGRTLTTKTETAALETKSSTQSSIEIPSNAEAGEYILRTTASYSDKKASASFQFKVYNQEAEPTCTDNILNQGEEGIDCGGPCEPCKSCPETCGDKNSCTADECSAETGFECKHKVIMPCCGNLQCESLESYESCPSDCTQNNANTFEELNKPEKIEEAAKVAESNAEGARAMCETMEAYGKDRCYAAIAEITNDPADCVRIADEDKRDKCYLDLSKVIDNSAICDVIVKDSKRDSCYMRFATKIKDFSVCSKIVNEYLKKACESLKLSS